MNPTPDSAHIPHEVLLRPAGIIGLLGIALIHLLDVVSKFQETPYLGALYVVLIAGCAGAAALLLRRDARAGWRLAAVAPAATLVAFFLSRTTGLPMSSGDVGNWAEPLGLASMFCEAAVLGMSVYSLKSKDRLAIIPIPVVTPARGGVLTNS